MTLNFDFLVGHEVTDDFVIESRPHVVRLACLLDIGKH